MNNRISSLFKLILGISISGFVFILNTSLSQAYSFTSSNLENAQNNVKKTVLGTNVGDYNSDLGGFIEFEYCGSDLNTCTETQNGNYLSYGNSILRNCHSNACIIKDIGNGKCGYCVRPPVNCKSLSDNNCNDHSDECFLYRGGKGDEQRCESRQNVGINCYDGACYANQGCIPGAKTSSSDTGMIGYCGNNQQGPGEPCFEAPHCVQGYFCNDSWECEKEAPPARAPVDTCTNPPYYDNNGYLIYACRKECNDFEDDLTYKGPESFGCTASGSDYKCCKQKSIKVQLPSSISCESDYLSSFSSSIPNELIELADAKSISCVSSASACSSGIGYPAAQTIPGTNSVISCPSGGSYCCATSAVSNASTTDTCTTAGLGGNTWSCLAPANCPSGVYYSSSTDPAFYACPSDKPQYCCKTTSNGGGSGTTPPSTGGGAGTPTTPTETCTYYGVSCKATSDAADVVKSGSSETAPYKSGGQCGGNYQDVYECVNSTTGAKRLDSRPVPASNAVCAPGGSWCAISSSPCQKKGGLMGGVAPVPKCGDTAYNSTEANKTKAQGNPYCTKTYSVDYQCSDGTWEPRTTGYTPGICDATPWCNTATATSGTGEACPGAPSAVGGNCTSDKPICNRSGTQGDCVAQASVGATQFCAKASACQSNTCTAQACAALGGGTAPTAPPLSIDIYCPVIDTDGKPNTCYGSSTCPTGYTLKSSSLAHQACDAHTNGANPYCCHKDTAATAPGGALDPACPATDTDGKPNSCVDKAPAGQPAGANCPAGYFYKSATQGDSDCTIFRDNKPSVCCHQGSGT